MVRSISSCRDLFVPLGASGIESLALTHYVVLSGRERERVCSGGVTTLTTVGGRVTWLCPAFGNLDPQVAALALIHEALHSAGMPENPSTPGALTAQEISELVERACRREGVNEAVLLAMRRRP